ncbi:ABC transporter substrate-binding protein [Paenibacillus sp. IB182496]|uniref:ABC transporter substrate-binding protein n=1 Tax=Paenibacillus sabuli TaxID=2772509 RepID=A0A927BUQ1_9BACL|nr:ABC transporter substrate-binding protein [Paenibacillus sabuli]MBD2846682.1 ABC transporter substrate-binding protein [Paenibacillus sabuli]
MNIKTRQSIWGLTLALGLLLLIAAGCGSGTEQASGNQQANGTQQGQGSGAGSEPGGQVGTDSGDSAAGEAGSGSGEAAAPPSDITVTDSDEKAHTFAKTPEQVVILGSYPASMFQALGLSDLVVAVDDFTKDSTAWPPFVTSLPSVGSSKTPDMEQILTLGADAVLASYIDPDVATKLEEAGVPVLSIYGYKTELIPVELRTLGRLFGAEERAEAYAASIESHWALIESRAADLEETDKPTVYWESSSGAYRTFSGGTGADPLIRMAGGINIAGEEPVSNPQVSAEWLVEKNPDVIIKYASSTDLGFHGGNEANLKDIREEIVSRPGFDQINAVQNGRVYLISNKITSDPLGPVGLTYLAKWLHPERYDDLDPTALFQDILETYYGEPYKGEWVYE